MVLLIKLPPKKNRQLKAGQYERKTSIPTLLHIRTIFRPSDVTRSYNAYHNFVAYPEVLTGGGGGGT